MPVQAPSPADAHQRRLSCGAVTTPTTTSPSTISPIRVAHTGTPRTKFLVPSIGSITHCRCEWPVAPLSSPSTASRGRARDRVRRMPSSTEVSASVTGVRSGFVITCRSSALNLAVVSESASSASTWASRRSSVYWEAMAHRLFLGNLVNVSTMEINGVPLHPLVIHAAVVFTPLAALALIAFVALKAQRASLRLPTLALAVVAGGRSWRRT